MPKSVAGSKHPILDVPRIDGSYESTRERTGYLEYDRRRNLLTLRGWRFDDGPETLTDHETAGILDAVARDLDRIRDRLYDRAAAKEGL